MGKKSLTILFDKYLFVWFYAGIMIYNYFIIRLISLDTFLAIRLHWFRYIYTAWAFLIVICDIVTKRLFKSKVKIFWGIAFLIAVLSVVFQPNPRNMMQIQQLITFGILTYICVSAALDAGADKIKYLLLSLGKQTAIIITVLCILSIIVAVLMLAKVQLPTWVLSLNEGGIKPDPLAHSFFLLPDDFGRYRGLFIYQTEAGNACYITILLDLFLLEQKKLSKWFCALSIPSCVIMIMLADCRESFISLALILLFVFLFYLIKKTGAKKALLTIGSICFIGLLGVVAVVILYVRKIMAEGDLTFIQALNTFSSSRIKLWTVGWNAFLERKIIGWGWLWNNEQVGAKFTDIFPNHHNFIINLLAWTGITGLIGFFAALIYSLKEIYKNRFDIAKDHSKWLFVLIVCVLVQALLDICLFGEDSHFETVYFWICLGYLIYLRYPHSENIETH